MDKNHQQTSINLTWDHNLASHNPIIHHHHQIPQFPGFSIMSSPSDLSSSVVSQESTKQAPQLGPNTRDDDVDVDVFPPGGETMVGLRLGRHYKEYGDGYFPLSNITETLKSPKRSRASYHNTQTPCCQVEGCNLDLKSAKDYHGRHRICQTHSKSPKVVVAGIECRFCQQCSRFHGLSEFDDNKRSCRRRLSEHNARRRKVQPADSVQLNSSARLASASSYDQRPQNVALGTLPAVSFSNSRWENIGSTSLSGNALFKPSKSRFCSDTALHSCVSNLNMDSERSLPSGILDHQYCLHDVTTNHSTKVPDLVSGGVHSLLSFKSWSFNEGETESTSSMEGHVHNPPAMRYAESAGISNDLSLFQTSKIQAGQDQTAPVSSMVYADNDQQEQHIYGFNSTQRDL